MRRIKSADWKVVEQAIAILEEANEEAQEYLEDRSEAWREGERGEEYAIWVDNLETCFEALNALEPSPYF